MAHRRATAGAPAGGSQPVAHVVGAGTLAPFVSQLAIEVAEAGVPAWSSIDGSLLSADISGFTALSERLASKGKVGAEALTELINAAFTALIDAAGADGGEVVKFGGDALLIMFRGPAHQRRATDAAVAMHRALQATPAAKRANLSMTVGVADGPFDVFVIGSGSRDLVITGPRVSEVVRLEGAARSGETLVSATVAAHLPPAMRVGVAAGGMVVASGSGIEPARTTPIGSTTSTVVGDDDLARYVPVAVVERLSVLAGLTGEHRLVTVGFVEVTGIAAQLASRGTSAVGEDLTVLFDAIVEACDRYAMVMLHSDITEDGVKFVVCAGAPVTAGDTADAVLRAALSIAAVAAPFSIRQGVQSGRVFAGFVGNDRRRTYTVMGDAVNTAARMVGRAADREVVAVAATLRETRSVFASEALEPFLVKGKADPVIAHKVGAATDRLRRDAAGLRLIGRQRELDVLATTVAGAGRAVELVGVAGGGKSRLLDALCEIAEDVVVHRGSCTPYGAATPYAAFRSLLRDSASIPAGADPETAGRALAGVVRRVDPGLMPMLPLLATPFGARVAPTAQADAIDPEFRRIRIHEVVVDYLDALGSGDVLMLIEDAHWIDAASGELVSFLVRACARRRWSVVVARRPEGDRLIADAGDHAVELVLEPLDEHAIHLLAIDSSSRALGDRDLAMIAERAEGNPLYAIELARALASTTVELPSSIEQIITSRLDRLPPGARRLVRTAAVLGNQFDERDVRAMMTADGAGASTDEALVTGAHEGTIARLAGTTWTFTHALYRDAAYAGLPFARRRQLHRLAARLIEERMRDPAAAASLLSLHFAAARAHPQTWQHSLVAAAAADANGATIEAAVLYERALSASRWCTDVADADRARVAERLGDMCYEIGRFDDAKRALTKARRHNGDRVAATRLIRKLGSVHERQGRPDRALHWYDRAARSIPATAGGREWAAARADVRLAEAGLRARRNENETCLGLATAARRDARLAASPQLEALALERIQLALAYMRRPDTDGAGRRALELHRRLDDHAGVARTLINLGIEAYFNSDWTTASEHYLEAMDIAQRAGSVVLAATAAINSAEIISDQGSWSRAIELLDSARRNYDAVGYTAGTAAATLFTAVAATRDGRYDDAAACFAQARQTLARLHMADLVDDLESRELELRVHTRLATIDDCAQLIARYGPGHPSIASILRCRSMLEHRAGDPTTASRSLRDALRLQPTGYEGMLIRLALVAIAPHDPEAGAWRDDAAATMHQLGVTSPPPLPTL